MNAQAETETAPASPARAVPAVPLTLAPINVGEMCAVLATMAIAGQSHAGLAHWQLLVQFVPWYAQVSGRGLEGVWAMPVDAYAVGISDRIESLKARFPDAIEGLGRVARLLGDG